jgi:hypothetical protein
LLVLCKENPKICICKEGKKKAKIHILNIEYEFEKEKDKKLIKEKQKYVEQLDNGLIAIHLSNGKIALFYLSKNGYKRLLFLYFIMLLYLFIYFSEMEEILNLN